MKGKLNIAFVWHMHQPVYRDALTGDYALPWVLYHATKDYYDMVSILSEFPDIHQTFNLVPSLMEQLMDYASGDASDLYRHVSLKPSADLTRDDKIFILKNFFNASMENMIMPIERYRKLCKKRGFSPDDGALRQATRFFSTQDYLDLQVLFNLVWIDPVHIKEDPFLAALYKKGRNFTETEKQGLLDRQIEITATVLPLYREFMEKGIIEVSTTPYYHTIMPVLLDSECARTAMPHVTLPKKEIKFPEDVAAQLNSGVELYREVFGRAPAGLWPSEGSVSMEVLPFVSRAGFSWAATDEEILAHTINRSFRRDAYGNPQDTFLYKPYSVNAGDASITLLFRDHILSDLIGFDYARMDPEDASNDLVSRLTHIASMMERPEDHVVSIILDGENAWETYKNDGRDFLLSLYGKLSGHPGLKCVTVSEYLSENPPAEKLDWLFPGSWISHNFKIWIGHEEDNAGWDLISEARGELKAYEASIKDTPGYEGKSGAVAEAWKEIYIAEGSDWFWWYGEEHSSANDEQFDALFRGHLKKVYRLMDIQPPVALDIPIAKGDKAFFPASAPTAFINPVIDGEVTNYFEWMGAGRIEHEFHGAAMHREIHTEGLVEGIAYGFSREEIFFRFDYRKGLDPFEGEWRFMITFLQPSFLKIDGSVKGTDCGAEISKRQGPDKVWKPGGALTRIASDRVVELAVPLKTLGVKGGETIRVFIDIDAGELGPERWPLKGFFVLDVPDEDFEREDWFV